MDIQTLFIYQLIFVAVILFYVIVSKSRRRALYDEKVLEEERRKELERKLEYERRKEERKAKERKEHTELLFSIYESICNRTKEFNEFLNYENYFKYSQLNSWINNSKLLYDKADKIAFNNIDASNEVITNTKQFINYFANCRSLRSAYNSKFIEKEINHEYLNTFIGLKLDVNQKRAVVINEDNNLVIAGAGSGKTTVITAKVKYLLDVKRVKPDEILLLSFTRKACDEMNSRLSLDNQLKAITFHQLGLKIIGEATNKKPSVFDEGNSGELLKSFIRNLLKDPTHAKVLTDFIVNYSKPLKSTEEFENHGEYIDFIRENSIKSYKKVTKLIKGNTTLLREQCKSIEEVLIANYLFLNGIKYEYERPYEVDTADKTHSQYRPDFYLLDYKIYIEHFGLDKNGNVPHWFGKDDYANVNSHYQNSREWKLKTHKQYNTKLIQTFSYENTDGNLLELLEEKLIKAGVVINPLSTSDIWHYLEKEVKEDVEGFYDLISTFHSLFKSGNYTFSRLNQYINGLDSYYERNRLSKFVKLYQLYNDYYSSVLQEQQVVDFNDMISKAYQHVQNREFNSGYKYILVDEYQDISMSRYQLIKSIKDQNNGTTLFCVGDDWQSIYRFAGSDISLFTKFSAYYGETAVTKIEKTYRFTADLVTRSTDFILKNPNQISKEILTNRDDNLNSIEVLYNDRLQGGNYELFYKAVEEIGLSTKGKDKITILILGRYSFDIETIKKEMEFGKVLFNNSKFSDKKLGEVNITFPEYPHLTAQYFTVHKSKGKEADFVILLNCVSGKKGFPSQFSDDPILNMVLSEGDNYPNAEERRLFYVAITRTKEKTYILSNSIYKSKFVKEIDSSENIESVVSCPRCIRGELFMAKEGVSNNGRWQLYKCKNWAWGCDYIEWKNPESYDDDF